MRVKLTAFVISGGITGMVGGLWWLGLCHQVTLLDYGTAVVSGPPGVIRTDPQVLDAYLGTAEDGDDVSVS